MISAASGAHHPWGDGGDGREFFTVISVSNESGGDVHFLVVSQPAAREERVEVPA